VKICTKHGELPEFADEMPLVLKKIFDSFTEIG